MYRLTLIVILLITFFPALPQQKPAQERDSVPTDMDELVISGTLKPMRKLESPVVVEVYSQQFFKKNPVPSIFEALQQVNGVRPQLNCNVCNTGDIHINGLDGPYTMVTIDGMPVNVSTMNLTTPARRPLPTSDR